MKPVTSSALMLLLIISSFFSGCSKASSNNAVNPSTCAGTAYSFSADVKPIFTTSCAISGCHDAASTNSGGPFTTYALIHAKASTIEGQVNAGLMPQSGSITADQKKKIICWVESGAPNN